MPPSRLRLSLLAGLAVCGLASAANAASANFTARGPRLALDGDCAREVVVRVAPGPIAIEISADRAAELAPFRLDQEADGARFGAHGECDRGDGVFGDRPTLRMTVSVPPGTPLTLDASSSAAWEVGDTGAAVRVDLSGSGRMRIGRIGPLTVDLSGSGEMRVAAVRGPVRLDASGSADVRIEEGEIDSLSAELSGSGELTVGQGQVGRAHVAASGSGAVALGGTVGDLDADLSGSGGVRVARLTGRLRQEVSGSGTVEIEGR